MVTKKLKPDCRFDVVASEKLEKLTLGIAKLCTAHYILCSAPSMRDSVTFDQIQGVTPMMNTFEDAGKFGKCRQQVDGAGNLLHPRPGADLGGVADQTG